MIDTRMFIDQEEADLFDYLAELTWLAIVVVEPQARNELYDWGWGTVPDD